MHSGSGSCRRFVRRHKAWPFHASPSVLGKDRPSAGAGRRGATVLHVISDALNVWWLHREVCFVAAMIGLTDLPVALGITIMR
jgi:hypothetical protein